MTTPDHWSFSQWSEFASCGHRYRLKRIENVRQIPSVAAVAGKAFHRWTEHHDLEAKVPGEPWDEYLEEMTVNEEKESQIPRDQWQVSGRRSRANPNKEDLGFWQFYGLELIQSYLKWYKSTKWEINRDLPPDKDGRTVGIEYGLDVQLGGEQFIAFLDRIAWNEKSQLGIVDYKTGSRMRHSIQLGQYAAALFRHGVRVHWGALYDARRGIATEPVDLTGWTPTKVESVLAPQQFMRQNGIFPVVPGEHCDWCPVRKSCEYHL